jgi:ABC-type glutathione transport system ATPase component
MKILILGYSGSGKSTAAEILSEILDSNPPKNCSDYIIQDMCDHYGLDPNEVATNKSAYRTDLLNFGILQQLIDPAYPVTQAIKETDIITGVRTRDNYNACRRYFDLILWVDSPSATKNHTDFLDHSDADMTIPNNGTVEDLRYHLTSLFGDFT